MSAEKLTNYTPAKIATTENMSPKAVVTADQWNSRINQLITQGNLTADALQTLISDLGMLGVTELVRTKDSKMRHVRLNSDGVLEVSADGTTWVATASSGHIILDGAGTVLPQRSRLQFKNTNIQDLADVTVITGVKGDKGDTGVQGPQGTQGVKGDKGDTGYSIIPSVDQNTGLMSFAEGPSGVVPASVNVRGPQGPQGVQGVQGPAGPKGEQGIQGPIGPQGIQGPQGARGLQGIPGDQGPQGVQGEQGPRGLTGPQGVKGDTGPQGEVGARGLKGDTGPKGDKGDTGATGPQGPQGVQGPLGPQGLKGDKGADGTSFAIKGIYPTLYDLQTAHPTGVAGDAYAVGTEISNVIYNWSIDTSNWVNLGSLQGPQGPQGVQGIQGPQGVQGVKGDTGPKGDKGDVGDKGDTGKGYYPQGTWAVDKPYVNNTTQIDVVFYEGSSYFCKQSHTSSADVTPLNAAYWSIMSERGLQGIQGEQGLTGPKGDQGTQGVQGVQGPKGDQGVAGADGKSAYASAVDGGFSDTEAVFNTALADVKNKVDKQVPATVGNIATLDANGNLTDSGKQPSDFAASTHSHSGIYEPLFDVLSIGKGGTGANTAEGARVNLDAAQPYHGTVTLAASSWSAEAPYSYALSAPGMTIDDNPYIGVVHSWDEAANNTLDDAWAKAKIRGTATTDTIVLIARGDKPAVNIPIFWRGSR